MRISLAVKHPELVCEWSDRNLPVTADDVSYGANAPYWWKGRCGHEWQASPKARSLGENCPICANKRIIPGINDLKSQYPKLMEEWSDRNTVDPEKTGAGSHRKAWWRCSTCGNEWETRIELRTLRDHGCPYCKGKLVMPGFNDMATRRPDLAEEWAERNGPVTPQTVTESSDRKAWWKCSVCSHEWKARIADRSAGSGCPCCSYRVVSAGINDLKTAAPELCREWSSRNTGAGPERTSPASRMNVWWECSVCGYEWQAVVSARVKGLKCPVCSGRKVMTGYNDLATTDPDVTGSWDFSVNTLSPYRVARHSCESVHWKCRYGHSFSRMICDYADGNRECPYCRLDLLASLPVLAVMWYAKKSGLTAETDSDRLIEVPVEACVPDIRLAVDIVTSECREARVQQKWKRMRSTEKDVILAQIHVGSTYDPCEMLRVIKKAFAKADIYIESSEQEDLAQIRKIFDRQRRAVLERSRDAQTGKGETDAVL